MRGNRTERKSRPHHLAVWHISIHLTKELCVAFHAATLKSSIFSDMAELEHVIWNESEYANKHFDIGKFRDMHFVKEIHAYMLLQGVWGILVPRPIFVSEYN